jgi:REP element-mobilizing transposase RayT
MDDGVRPDRQKPCALSPDQALRAPNREREFGNQLRRVYRTPAFWSRSCCIISCGGAPLSVIKQYVEQQSSPE